MEHAVENFLFNNAKNNFIKKCFQGLRAGYPRHALQTILTMSLWDVMKKQYEAYRFKKIKSTKLSF